MTSTLAVYEKAEWRGYLDMTNPHVHSGDKLA